MFRFSGNYGGERPYTEDTSGGSGDGSTGGDTGTNVTCKK